MIGSKIIWKMAISNLLKQWKQTLLAIAAGSIGAMLIAISVVNFDSVKQSGAQWLDKRLGSINWQLKPTDLKSNGFTPAEVDRLVQTSQLSGNHYRLLPYVSTEAAVVSENAQVSEVGEGDKLQENRNEYALNSLLLIGFPLDAAAQLDYEREDLWKSGLGSDELIINSNLAELLHVETGDTLTVLTNGKSKLLRIRSIVDEYGITGFREAGAYNGTLIASEETVRELSGIEDNVYPAILVGHTDPKVDTRAMFYDTEIDFTIQYLKGDFESRLEKMNFTIIIGIISVVAIISSLMFMRQLLIMIGESRHQMYGIFRALGMTERHIFSMLAAEVLMLSLLTALAGTVLGIIGGYALIGYFFSSFSEELARMSGAHIPISAHISLGSTMIVFIAILLFMSVISLLAARKAGKMKIAEAIKGGGHLSAGNLKRKASFGFKLWLSLGIASTLAHLYLVFIDTPDFNELDEGNILLILFLWLITCFTVLYIALYLVSLAGQPISALLRRLGIPTLSIMLAVRYPRQHSGRTYTSGLLFALMMMLLVVIISLLNFMQTYNAVDRNSQTIFGYGAYAPYNNIEERNLLLQKIKQDEILSEHLTEMDFIETYMLLLSEDGWNQSSVVATTEAISQAVPLVERAPQFENDEEAWRAVMDDASSFIVLPYDVIDEKSHNYWKNIGNLRAGDEFPMKIYPDGLRFTNETKKPVVEKTFIVAGFAQKSVNETLIEHYSSLFVHPAIAAELKPYGYKWSNHTHLGFVLFKLDYMDVRLVQMLEERLIINGILNFEVPYLKNSASVLVMKQAGNGFIGFTVLSALIGLMGLAIIQYRAVKERGQQIAMMRCIGVPAKQIMWMYMLEGFFVSIVGMLVGWLVGTSGMHILLNTATNDVASYEEPLQLSYPFEIIVPIVIGLVLASLLINTAPAKAALKLKAAIALRMSSD